VRPPEHFLKQHHLNNQGASVRTDARKPRSQNFKNGRKRE